MIPQTNLIDSFAKHSEFIAKVVEFFREKNVILEINSDFLKLENAIKTQSERKPLAPRFRPQGSFFKETNAFWILGRNMLGEIVHTQAMQLIDIKEDTLAHYLKTRYTEFVPANYPIDAKHSYFNPSPGSLKMTGRLSYHGELWLKQKKGVYRGTEMSALLARLAMAVAILKWSPDYVFGFMFPVSAYKGLAAREGYMHTDPASIVWVQPDCETMQTEWLVWMSSDDIRYLMQLPSTLILEQPRKMAA